MILGINYQSKSSLAVAFEFAFIDFLFVKYLVIQDNITTRNLRLREIPYVRHFNSSKAWYVAVRTIALLYVHLAAFLSTLSCCFS